MRQNTVAPWAELVPGVGHMTADELLTLSDGEWEYELVEGRLVRMSPTGLEHLYITDALHAALRAFVRLHQLGLVTLPDTGFRLPQPGVPDSVLAPDVAFISSARLAQLPPPGDPGLRKFLPFAPDLAAEVASPDQHKPEMAEKASRYLAVGTHLVWVVWPSSRTVDVWRPGDESPSTTFAASDTLDGLEVVPGFTLPVADLFASLPEVGP